MKDNEKQMSRRKFIQNTAAISSVPLIVGSNRETSLMDALVEEQDTPDDSVLTSIEKRQAGMPMRRLGKTDIYVSVLCCGGFGGDNVDALEFFILGDVNGDGLVNGLDIAPFIDVVVLGTSDPITHARADLNGDGAVNGLDVPDFIDCVILGGCTTPIPEPCTAVLASLAMMSLLCWRHEAR